MVGAISELEDLELTEVEDAIGARSFSRGRGYARGNRVASIEWDPDVETLTGSVVGQGGRYTTFAYFGADGDGGLAFDEGECSCPVGYNCKHVAAIVIAATDARGRTRSAPARRAVGPAAKRAKPVLRAAGPVATKAKPSSWEGPLRALVDAPAAATAGIPLAIELVLQRSGGGGLRLTARLMRPAARGGWVNGSLTWGGLDSWQVTNGGYRPDHLALVRELYAIHRPRAGATSYHHSYGGDRTVDLGGCERPQLWSVLDEAARLGLALVHRHAGLQAIPPPARAEILIDVTRRPDSGSVVTAGLRIDGEDAAELEPVVFVGSNGHGIVCAERAAVASGESPENWRLRLARLAKPAHAQLRRMVLDGERLEVPAGDLDRFADEFCPALRHVARIVSSDGSFTPPEISAPKLVLRSSYGAGHAVDVGWEWAYEVGSTRRRAPLATDGVRPGFRDLEAERG
ncbi:MAG TPA: SWIM zinc finger family protein, partial [Solirubrobacteraceae bacterium]|nr:SWIM zinc finger family protein [Solirubrobacteraceae bacterium]